MDFGLTPFIEPWHWVALGAALIGLEILVPGTLLMWFGIAGIVTGAVLFFVDMGFALQILVFAVLSVVAIFGVRKVASNFLDNDDAEAEHLNQRGANMVGRQVTITEPVVNGAGAAKFGDSRWSVRCDSALEVGATAIIVRVDGATLHVEPVE